MQQITNVSIDVLKVHPRNQEFYDDIEGEQYEKFKKSIQEDGILTPLIVSPDMTIISGHQRYKGACDLDYKLLPVIIREDLDNEDEKLKKLLATNFGRLKNNPIKQGKVFAEYEKLCGVTYGNNQWTRQNVATTQEQIAKELGIDVRTIQRLKKLQTLSPDLQQLIEDGSVKYTTALNVFSKLSNDEQEKLINEIGQEKIKEMTGKQIQQYIDEKQQLEQSYNELSKKYNQAMNKQPEVIEVDNTDYKKIEDLHKLLNEKENKLNSLSKEKELLERKVEIYKDDSDEYKKLKSEMAQLTREREDIGRKIESATSLVGLVKDVENFVKEKLSPIKYSRSILEMKNDKLVMENVSDILYIVESWCQEMRNIMPNNNKIIDVEEF